jgi:hypothetical protein
MYVSIWLKKEEVSEAMYDYLRKKGIIPPTGTITSCYTENTSDKTFVVEYEVNSKEPIAG